MMHRHSVDGFVFYNMQHVISSPRRHGDLSIVRVFILFHRGPVPSSIQILLYTHCYGFSKIKQTRRKTALLDTDSQMCSMSSIRTHRSCQGHKSNRPLGTCYGARSAAAPARVGGCSAASWRSSHLSSPCCASRHPSGCPCDCPCRCPSHGSCGCPCGCSASAPGRAAPCPILRASPPRAPRWLTQPNATPPHSPPKGRVGAVGAVGAGDAEGHRALRSPRAEAAPAASASRRTASGSASCSASLCRAPRTEAKPAAMAWLW